MQTSKGLKLLIISTGSPICLRNPINVLQSTFFATTSRDRMDTILWAPTEAWLEESCPDMFSGLQWLSRQTYEHLVLAT